MNYLAHFHIADLTGTSLPGSLLGDFVRGPLDGRHAPEIERGIRLHRRIDSYTDAHPVVRAAKARIAPPHRRYAGILLDVFFDHFLALDWPRYHGLPLEDFTAQVYQALADYPDWPSERLRRGLGYMRSRHLLLSYRQRSGVDDALAGLATRLSRANPLAGGGRVLDAHYAELEQDFRRFYPQLLEHARRESA